MVSTLVVALYGRCLLDLSHTLEHAPQWRPERTVYARDEYPTEDVQWWGRWRSEKESKP